MSDYFFDEFVLYYTEDTKDNYGKIILSEIDGETYVFQPKDTNIIYPEAIEEINKMLKKLNSKQ